MLLNHGWDYNVNDSLLCISHAIIAPSITKLFWQIMFAELYHAQA